tara:strand:- start:12 stop:200 length:189 start_codon:yes stop_codon:yes gene_type:complete
MSKESRKRYRQSEKGKATRRRYEQSIKGKNARNKRQVNEYADWIIGYVNQRESEIYDPYYHY